MIWAGAFMTLGTIKLGAGIFCLITVFANQNGCSFDSIYYYIPALAILSGAFWIVRGLAIASRPPTPLAAQGGQGMQVVQMGAAST